MTKKLLPIGLLLFSSAFLQFGCSKIRGCTDSYSDNFDPEATEDDDTCVPTRQKFIGEYDSHGTTNTGDTVLTDYDQVTISITDETANKPDELILGFTNFDLPIYALGAVVVSKYKLSIPYQTIGAFSYSGDININGTVLEMSYRRLERIEITPDVFEFDTLYLNLYGFQEVQ